MTIGDNLKKYRKIVGLTQAGLAERAGIAVSSYQRYERGERTPTERTLDRLALALGIAPDMLTGVDRSPAALIKNARHSLGLTPAQAAERAGMDEAAYTAYESGETPLDADTYYAIYRAFGVRTSDIPPHRQFTVTEEDNSVLVDAIDDNLKGLNKAALVKILDYTNDLRKVPDYQRKRHMSLETTKQVAVDPEE